MLQSHPTRPDRPTRRRCCPHDPARRSPRRRAPRGGAPRRQTGPGLRALPIPAGARQPAVPTEAPPPAAGPRERDERRAKVFVAGFSGNAPMAFSGTRVSAKARGLAVGSQTLSIGDAAHASLESARTAGVRPEAFHVKAGAATDGAV